MLLIHSYLDLKRMSSDNQKEIELLDDVQVSRKVAVNIGFAMLLITDMIASCGGRVELYNNPGAGTRFVF